MTSVICYPGAYGLGGFCGGEGGHAMDHFDRMQSISATEFARIVLVAEGLGERWEHSEFRRDLERFFEDVLGYGEVRLDDDPPAH